MFDQLFGNMQQQQEALKEKLASIVVEEKIEDGAVVITGTGAGEITNVQIDESKLDLSDKEQIEDLVLIAVNNYNAKVKELEQEEMQKLIQEMLPGGLGGMFGM